MAEGIVLQIQDKQIVVDIGKKSGVKSGMKLIIYQAGEPIRHPVSGKVPGPGLIKELGEATIQSVMDEMSVALLNKTEQNAVIQALHKVITR